MQDNAIIPHIMERMNFERPRNNRWEAREGHKNPEEARLEKAIEHILRTPTGDPGLPTKDGRIRQLEMLLSQEPQRDRNGRLRYLLTSGLAVELITGFRRDHHDLDLVIMDPSQVGRWRLMGTDNVTPGKYWADMEFDAEELERTAVSVSTRQRGRGFTVETVHPAIIMVQKSSDAFGRPPRQKDKDDVEAIATYWHKKEGYTFGWNDIVRRAIDALPPHQVDKTVERLRRVLQQFSQ